MTFGEQLRDWLGGLWSDFWRVPFRHVWPVLLFVALAVAEAAWRIDGALNPSVRHAYELWFPVRLLAMLALMWLARRTRR